MRDLIKERASKAGLIEVPELRINDYVRVTKCKDCKHRSDEMYDYYGNPNNKVYVCQIHDLATKPDWFCADGEKADDKK